MQQNVGKTLWLHQTEQEKEMVTSSPMNDGCRDSSGERPIYHSFYKTCTWRPTRRETRVVMKCVNNGLQKPLMGRFLDSPRLLFMGIKYLQPGTIGGFFMRSL